MSARRRFYREASATPASPYGVLLDGKPIRTPAGGVLVLPNQALAAAIAEEWQAQDETIRPESMILTKLANTASDRVAERRADSIAQILAFAKSELLCYRASSPDMLVSRQSASWDPLLAWAQEKHGIALRIGTGIGFVEQPQESLDQLERTLARCDDYVLTGLLSAATLLGSALIALALAEGQLDADAAHKAANLDELYQAERWGQDEAAAKRLRTNNAELAQIARFLRLAREAQ